MSHTLLCVHVELKNVSGKIVQKMKDFVLRAVTETKRTRTRAVAISLLSNRMHINVTYIVI